MSSVESLVESAVHAFREHYGCPPALAVVAPGRANLIGEHTDYNDGHVLPIAIDRFLVAAAGQRADRLFRVYSAGLDETFQFNLDDWEAGRPRWASYVVGVVVELERDGLVLSGKDLVVRGNIPIGSGLSSSAALEVAIATAVERLDGIEIDDRRLVGACRRADHNFVGVKSGPMDQFASRACRAGCAGLLDCRSLNLVHHPLPGDVECLSIYSGIPRQLAASAYNERQSSCQRAVTVIQRRHPEVAALRDATLELVECHKAELGDPTFRRARHVVTEQARVFEVLSAFERNDLECLGRLLLEGHRSLRDDYEVSLPILDEMVDWLYGRPGVVGARLTGAGFGGSLVCLIRANAADVEEMTCSLAARFGARTPEPPALWRLRAVDGARHQPSFRP